MAGGGTIHRDYRQKKIQVIVSKSPTQGIGEKCSTLGWRLACIDLDIFFTVVLVNTWTFFGRCPGLTTPTNYTYYCTVYTLFSEYDRHICIVHYLSSYLVFMLCMHLDPTFHTVHICVPNFCLPIQHYAPQYLHTPTILDAML